MGISHLMNRMVILEYLIIVPTNIIESSWKRFKITKYNYDEKFKKYIQKRNKTY